MKQIISYIFKKTLEALQIFNLRIENWNNSVIGRLCLDVLEWLTFEIINHLLYFFDKITYFVILKGIIFYGFSSNISLGFGSFISSDGSLFRYSQDQVFARLLDCLLLVRYSWWSLDTICWKKYISVEYYWIIFQNCDGNEFHHLTEFIRRYIGNFEYRS